MQTLEQLKAAREQIEQAEAEVLADIQAKAQLLGYSLVRQGTVPTPQTPATKRKRRTKAEMEAARSQEQTGEVA
jgi:hypothetical protein